MEQIIKTYLGIFFIVVLTVSGFGLMSSAVIARSANNMACQMAMELQCSNIASSVVDQCVSRVRDNSQDAYDDLTISYSENNAGKRIGKMVLTYHYDIPFIGISSKKKISRMLN